MRTLDSAIRRVIVPCALLMLAAPAFAQTPAADSNRPEVLPEAREMELALSAAPEHLRAGAGVYVLTETGYKLARRSTNKFTCIVNRDHPKALKPTCFDEEGTATIIPKIVRVGELMMQGKSLQEISADIKAGFQSGTFISPRRPGVAYMLSGDIRNVNPANGQISSFPPHVMFYAPNLTNEDIGADGTPGTPFVAYQGPQGYMIMLSGDGSAHDHADAAAPAANPVVDAARAVFPEHRKNIVAAFTSMPADKYTAKPMPPLMSFGEFALHIASANVYYCRRLGATAPVPAWLKPTAPKDQLVKLLDQTFEYCAPVLAQLTDASLGAKAAPLPNGTDAGTRAKALLDLIAGLDHHYGQAAAYLRMNGIVPPTAAAEGKGQH